MNALIRNRDTVLGTHRLLSCAGGIASLRDDDYQFRPRAVARASQWATTTTSA